MRTIAAVRLDKVRPAVILTRHSKIERLTSITVAPISSTIRDIPTEVRVGPRNGLDHESVATFDNITTVPAKDVGRTIGLLFDDQEADVALAISEAFELHIP